MHQSGYDWTISNYNGYCNIHCPRSSYLGTESGLSISYQSAKSGNRTYGRPFTWSKYLFGISSRDIQCLWLGRKQRGNQRYFKHVRRRRCLLHRSS